MTESYLSAGLKATNKKKRVKPTIRVCNQCQCPLIFTFAFAYAERYCLNCGAKGGMLGTGTDVPLTKELRIKNRAIQALWGVIYGNKQGLQPSGSQRTGCKKCAGGAYHINHLTESEVAYDKEVRKLLESAKGLFDYSKSN